MFSDIVNRYWIKFMAENVVKKLEDHFFCFSKQRDRKIIHENSLTFLWSAILGKNIPWPRNSFNSFNDTIFVIQILNLKNKYIISYQIWWLKITVKVTTCSFHFLGYHVITCSVEMGTFHRSSFRGCSFDYFSVIRSRDMKIYYHLILIFITIKTGGYSFRESCAINDM